MPQKYIFWKFHKKSFRIRTNTMLTTKHAKYEGLTPRELGEKIMRQLTLVFYLLTLGNPWFPIVFLK